MRYIQPSGLLVLTSAAVFVWVATWPLTGAAYTWNLGAESLSIVDAHPWRRLYRPEGRHWPASGLATTEKREKA